ncbi:aromatic acid exporter family protein [Synechococcus sp. UW105]|jgi:uncharacterized membrane protein YgaE (UPF0421/DUF939 family)|uniref:FUSC family protein n=2 Tax=unclassified Synechococcus TaxID=2626047 RepID=UPI000C973A12|nr:FUSC family protein [Synechococcus sp. UW105]MAS28965.1 FUSC family protein [Synechococcus sp. NAT40]RZO14802.1 MAG: FUSC family protein [Synechococcus sp. MED-G135]
MATTAMASVKSNLVRQSLRLGLSVLITCAIAQHFERITYLWYPLMAVIFVVDDQDENTFRAARGRILGTITGGLVTFIVHTILSGWIGILVSLLISIPLLRRLGWSSGLSTAAVITIMFLGIPGYSLLNWGYVFNRSVDTLIGIVVALIMGRLLWPKNRLARLAELNELQKQILHQRLALHQQALAKGGSVPAVNAEPVTRNLLEMERLVAVETSLEPHRHSRLERQRWRQRVLLWSTLQPRWLLVERLLERLYRHHDHAMPELSQQLDHHQAQGWSRLHLGGTDHSQTPLRIALEEEVTRLRWLLRSQERIEAAVT